MALILTSFKADAAEEDVKRAYRSLALQCHPDKRPPEERKRLMDCILAALLDP